MKCRDNAYEDVQDIDMAFDINAEIEPVNENDYQILDYDYGATEAVGEEEEIAIKACSALRFSQTRLSDLRPVENDMPLEYSYRPMDRISQFWAGPSHWKFRRNTNIRRPLIQAQQKTNATQKKTTKSTKKMPLDFFSFDKNEDKDFLSINSVQAKKVKKLACYNEPNPKKLKLPNDSRINSNFFEYFCYAPGILNKVPLQTETNDVAKDMITSNEPEINEEQNYHVRMSA